MILGIAPDDRRESALNELLNDRLRGARDDVVSENALLGALMERKTR